MANRYANLVGTNKIKDEYTKINTGFDAVQADMDAEIAAREQTDANLAQEVIDREAAVQAVDSRVDTIIQGGGPDKDAELVDIRTPDSSYTPERTINVAGDVTRDMQAQFVAHKADFVTISQFPIIPPEADDTARLQRAIDSVAESKKKLRITAGTYIISSKLSYITDNILTSSYDRDGIEIEGEVGTVIKASDTFPTDSVDGVMLDLDGNPTESEDNLHARVQIGNRISNIVFDGNDRAAKGIRIRGNVFGLFKNIDIQNIGGGENDAAIYIAGVTTAGKDDSDTTLSCVFESVTVSRSGGYGVFAANNRVGNLTFRNCDFGFCQYDGMRISFATLTLIGCLFNLNGRQDSNTTGGLSIVKSATGARNRGLSMNGCIFEGNFWHDINLQYLYGGDIGGLTFNPYQKADLSATPTQALIKIGGEAAESIHISGGRVQDYSRTYAYDIEGVHIFDGAADVTIENISFDSAGRWPIGKRYIVNSGAREISIARNKGAFRVTNIVGSTVSGVTGDGTEYTSVNLAGVTSMNEDYDESASFQSGRFTAPVPGLYEFKVGWTLTNFQAGQILVQVGFIKNDASTAVKYIANRYPFASGTYAAADKPRFEGSVKLKLNAGDTVIAYIMSSGGGTKPVGSTRDTANDFVFSGNRI